MDRAGTNTRFSSLPEDIVRNILGRLPLIDFQRARTLCSAWNRLASDPSFRRRLRSSSALPGFALFLSDDCTSQLLYLDLNDASKWRCIPLSFLPDFGASLNLLASSGGLLLLGNHMGGGLLVTNPITQQWKELPPMEVIRDPFYTALTTDTAGGSFTVAIAESELRNGAVTEIFESKTGRWRAGVEPALAGRWKRVASSMSTPWFYGSVPVYCKPVYCGGAFYHLTWDPEEMVSQLDVRKGAWRCAKGSGAVPGGAPWGVMEQGGKVVLVEMSYDRKRGGGQPAGLANYGSDATLSLWELRHDRLQWVRRHRVPTPPNSEYHVDKWQRFAIGEGYVCVTFLVPGMLVTFASQSEPQPGMIYDCGSATWLPMPDLPGIPWGSTSSLCSYTASLHPL